MKYRGYLAAALTVGFIVFFLNSCVTHPVSHSTPKYQFIDTPIYYVSIMPIRSKIQFYAFRLIVKNKTFQPIQVNWNKTSYLQDGEQAGGFMFDGIDYKTREAPKPNEVIMANDIFIRTIWPNVLVERGKDWSHQPMEDGRHGIEICIIGPHEAYTETLMLSFETRTNDD